MSDEAIRAAERAYRASGDPADGEAWVQAVLRTTGVNSTFLIARVIETQRALAAMAMISRTATYEGVRDPIIDAMRQPVTPDDIVDFLRGGRNWLQPGMAASAAVGAESIREEIDAEIVRDLIATGPNAHLPFQRGAPTGSAILCNHANENPGHCPCDPDCYCRQDGHTCSDVTGEPNPFDRECDLCNREATWRFKHTTVLPNNTPNGYRVEVICGHCLPNARLRRIEFNLSFMNRRAAEQAAQATQDSINLAIDMVRHHEVVDGDVPHDCGDPACGMVSRQMRRCHNDACTNMVPADGAVYCSNTCALNDA